MVVCNQCDKKITNYYNGYFRYLMTPNGVRIVQYDSINHQPVNYFPVCNLSETIENTKILKVNGGFVKSCTAKDSLLKIESFKIVEGCVGQVPDIVGNFTLIENLWSVSNIQIGNTSYIPPCEGSSQILFHSSGNYEGSLSNNFIAGKFSENTSSVMSCII